MATRKRRVEVEVVVDDNQANRKLKNVGDQSQKTGKQFSSMGTMVKAGLAAFGAREMLQAFSAMDQLKTQMDANEQRADVVFGNMADDAREWADEQNEAFGLGENALLGLASNMQDLLVPMGFAREEAKKLTEETLIVANALDDWKGGTLGVENATERITKAMLGEREGLVELGIKISEADVKTKLLEKGQEDLTGAALEQAKAQATLELITDKSADALDKYADRAGTAVAANKELRASTEEAKESAADFFGPILDKGKEVLGDVAVVGGAAGDAIAKMGDDGEGGMSKLIDTILRFDPILGPILNLFGAGADAIRDTGEAAEEAADKGFSRLGGEMNQIPTIQKKVAEGFDNLGVAADGSTAAARRHIEALEDQHDQLRASVDPTFAAIKNAQDYREAQDALNEAIKEHGPASDEALEAAEEVSGAWEGMQGALDDLVAMGIDPASEKARNMFKQMGVPEETIDAIIGRFERMQDEMPILDLRVRAPGIHYTDTGGGNAVPRKGQEYVYHEGGVVAPNLTPGTEVLARMLAGERVSRRAEPDSTATPTVVVQGFVGSELQLGQELDRILTRYYKRNGR